MYCPRMKPNAEVYGPYFSKPTKSDLSSEAFAEYGVS